MKSLFMRFTVKIYKGEKYYIARVPELGVTIQRKTKEEARKNLREAIQVHLEAMAEQDFLLFRVQKFFTTNVGSKS